MSLLCSLNLNVSSSPEPQRQPLHSRICCRAQERTVRYRPRRHLGPSLEGPGMREPWKSPWATTAPAGVPTETRPGYGFCVPATLGSVQAELCSEHKSLWSTSGCLRQRVSPRPSPAPHGTVTRSRGQKTRCPQLHCHPPPAASQSRCSGLSGSYECKAEGS